jgi:SAM-dependent methyltransferase
MAVPVAASHAVPLYDSFVDYDRFVNWKRRLAYELVFIERLLADHGAQRVLDVACGTGKHAIALARRGYRVTGADLSEGMIARARENAAQVTIETGDACFVVAGFGALADQVEGDFDALLCLGNSLPHVLTVEALHDTLADFAQVLRPGGLLFIQSRNYDAVMAERARWMPLQSRRAGDREWLFLRFYDFNADGTLTFHVVTLERDREKSWTQRVEATSLYPWLHEELSAAIVQGEFGEIVRYGDMTGAPFDQETSGNLIVTAKKELV